MLKPLSRSDSKYLHEYLALIRPVELGKDHALPLTQHGAALRNRDRKAVADNDGAKVRTRMVAVTVGVFRVVVLIISLSRYYLLDHCFHVCEQRILPFIHQD